MCYTNSVTHWKSYEVRITELKGAKMRKIYSYVADRRDFIEDANHQYVAWAKPPYEIVFKNCTEYDLKVLGQQNSFILSKGESKTRSSDNCFSRFVVNTPNGKFWFDEEGGVIVGREVRQGLEDVVPILNNGVIEFRHRPKKWTLKNRSIKKVQNPAYQIKVRNCTPYDIIIWLDNDMIDVVKSKWINTVSLPSGNHMLYFDTKEEEYVSHDKYGIWDDFIGPVNGCQMGIIEDFLNLEPSWKEIIDRKRGYAGWFEVEKIFKERMFFWQHFVGPGSIEPFIRELCSRYDAKKKEIEIVCNTIDYRLD